ncbi:MAG: hypothetical protein WBX11_16555 [Thiobacillaceae bacterium]|jgi:hypothetical protein
MDTILSEMMFARTVCRGPSAQWWGKSAHWHRVAACMLAVMALRCAMPAGAADPSVQASLLQWELRRLNEPTANELVHERAGNVFIYDGLTDRQVDRALDVHFNRIESMMFVGTVKTDAAGAARLDQQGNVETESGGCGSE